MGGRRGSRSKGGYTISDAGAANQDTLVMKLKEDKEESKSDKGSRMFTYVDNYKAGTATPQQLQEVSNYIAEGAMKSASGFPWGTMNQGALYGMVEANNRGDSYDEKDKKVEMLKEVLARDAKERTPESVDHAKRVMEGLLHLPAPTNMEESIGMKPVMDTKAIDRSLYWQFNQRDDPGHDALSAFSNRGIEKLNPNWREGNATYDYVGMGASKLWYATLWKDEQGNRKTALDAINNPKEYREGLERMYKSGEVSKFNFQFSITEVRDANPGKSDKEIFDKMAKKNIEDYKVLQNFILKNKSEDNVVMYRGNGNHGKEIADLGIGGIYEFKGTIISAAGTPNVAERFAKDGWIQKIYIPKGAPMVSADAVVYKSGNVNTPYNDDDGLGHMDVIKKNGVVVGFKPKVTSSSESEYLLPMATKFKVVGVDYVNKIVETVPLFDSVIRYKLSNEHQGSPNYSQEGIPKALVRLVYKKSTGIPLTAKEKQKYAVFLTSKWNTNPTTIYSDMLNQISIQNRGRVWESDMESHKNEWESGYGYSIREKAPNIKNTMPSKVLDAKLTAVSKKVSNMSGEAADKRYMVLADMVYKGKTLTPAQQYEYNLLESKVGF